MTDSLLSYIYDAVAINTIPNTATVLLGYDEPFTYGPLQKLFPKATVLLVTTSSNYEARICDCENGNDTPESAMLWAYNKMKAGYPWYERTIYSQGENWETLKGLAASYGMSFGGYGADVPFFLAWWNGEPVLYNQGEDYGPCVGHQYYRQSEYTFDMSVALSSWIWPSVVNTTPTTGAVKIGDEMFIKVKDTVYWFIAEGKASYWRTLPADAAKKIPAANIIEDDGSLLHLWDAK